MDSYSDIQLTSTSTLVSSKYEKYSSPYGVCISYDGDYALLTDRNTHRIYRIDLSTSLAVSIAGSGYQGMKDGIGTNSEFRYPHGIDISSDGIFALITDYKNHMIRSLIISTSYVSTVSGIGRFGLMNGFGTSSMFNHPSAISLSLNQRFALVADTYNHAIRLIILSTWNVSVLAGCGEAGNSNGIGTNSKFHRPLSITISPNGYYALVVDSLNSEIRRIVIPTASVTALYAWKASDFVHPFGIGFTPDGNYALITDTLQGSIYSIDLSTAFLRTLHPQYFLSRPGSLALSPHGNFGLIAEYESQTIRYIGINKSDLSYTFSCGNYSASDTQNATRGTVGCVVILCPSDYMTISTCGSSNTLIRVYTSSKGKELASSGDNKVTERDGCLSFSYIHQKSTLSFLWDCERLTLHQGCWESESCDGESTVSVFYKTRSMIKYSFAVVFGNESLFPSDTALMINYHGNLGRGMCNQSTSLPLH